MTWLHVTILRKSSFKKPVNNTKFDVAKIQPFEMGNTIFLYILSEFLLGE